MPKQKISEFSSTPANNTDIDSINIAEGCAPSGINDAIRELMAQLKDWQSGTSNDPYVVGSSGSLTLNQGTANGVAYLNGSKVVTSGSALTFDGTDLATTGGVRLNNSQYYYGKNAAGSAVRLLGVNSGNVNYIGSIDSGPTEVNYGAASSITAQYWNISGSEGMRLTSTGLGIGTSSPAYKLDVTGTINSGASTATGYNLVFRTSGITTGRAQTGLTNTSGDLYTGIEGSTAGQTISGSAAYSAYIGTFTSNPLYLITSGAIRATLDSSGNLGLGVTPSAWNTVTPVFQINKAALYGYGNEVSLSANYLFSSGDKYIASDFATRYNQASGQHRFYTAPSGTAGNAITFTQAMTLNASGNLGIGTTSPNTRLSVVGAGDNSTVAVFGGASGGTGRGLRIATGIPSGGSNNEIAILDAQSDQGVPVMAFQTAGTERARIDSSGNLLVGTTSNPATGRIGIQIGSTGSDIGLAIKALNNGNWGAGFYNSSGTNVGSIVINSSATAYNTSSDYRLKNTIAPMTNALARVAQLKPVTYKWNSDGSDGQGFIAHELAEVVPECVTGEKDAVNEDGTPKYQGIDTSFLVATLTAAIQELKAEFDAYKASHP
jgi:hypothetical protein